MLHGMISKRGLEVSTKNDRVLTEIDNFTDRVLRSSRGAEEILDATESNPEEPALQLAAAIFWLYGQTPEAQQNAASALAAAPGERLNPREAQLKTALVFWHQRSFEQAASAFEELTATWPEDLLAAKACEFIYYILGQQHSGPRFLAHMNRLEPFHLDDPDFLSMQAFAYELCGDMAQARQTAERGIELSSFNPWAQHALEHVLLWEGNSEAAIAVMEGWVSDWEASARPIHCHNTWHLALAHADRLDFDQAFEVFDQHVWLHAPEMVVEQLDSIAFLWRAEMAGAQGEQARWAALVPNILDASADLFMPFSAAQYAYALARAGEGERVEELLSRVQRRAADSDAEATRVWSPTGLAVVRAAAALGEGDAVSAALLLEPAMTRVTEIGGSDAQDDLFRFAQIDSLRRAGRQSEARSILSHRLTEKTSSPMEEALLRSC